MFIKKTRSKNYIYLSLVETYRKDGKVHHRTLAKLGRLDQLQKTSPLQQLEINLREFSSGVILGLKKTKRIETNF